MKMINMIFDTHAHYDDESFDEDREMLLASMKEAGIGNIVNVGSDFDSLEKTIALTEKYPFMYGAIGIHPSETGNLDEAAFEKVKCYAKNPKVVAIGETGLDYHWDEPARDVQKHWFIRQIQLAGLMKLPLIIHSRDAAEDTFDILKEYDAARDVAGIIHCFSYEKEMAMRYVDMNFYIGVGGVVTFKNARKLKEVVSAVPIERIVLETDSPYLAPEPHRGSRNSSLNLTYVAAEIAKIKGISPEEVIRITGGNAGKVYRI